MHRIVRCHAAAICPQRLARIRIDIKTWKIAAGDIDPDFVSLLEHIRSRVELDRELVGLALDGPTFEEVHAAEGAEGDDAGDADRFAVIVVTKGQLLSSPPSPEHRGVGEIVDEIVVRLSMLDAGARYHVPIIMSPHAYSLWSSTPRQSDP